MPIREEYADFHCESVDDMSGMGFALGVKWRRSWR